MLPDHFSDLRQRFPTTFTGGLDLATGWIDLLWAYGEIVEEADAECHVTYAKEKYGSLSLFVSAADYGSAAEDLEYHVEVLSSHICNDCGAPGSLRSDRGWWRTNCDACDRERRQ